MDIDTRCRMAEAELREWIDGLRSNTNTIQNVEPDRALAIVRTEQADAATIERKTAALQALYTIREGRKP
jgi:hypothetical protein